MQCPEENVIVDFLRGDLGDTAREGLEAHLDGCPSCCQIVADLARIFRSSDAWGATLGGTEELGPASSVGDTGLPVWSTGPLLPEGSKLGRYVVLHRVGAGGMGVVYAAYDPELDRKVALKLLIGGGSGSSPKVQADQRTRLLREAQAMARLSHPNVITVHDVGTVDDQVFLAMEFVEGCTLKDWLHAGRRPWREVLEVFVAAGRGLAAAHAAGLIHRDFKPDNVLLGSRPHERPERVLVTDFGLARPARGQTDAFTAVSTLQSGQQVLSAQLTQTGALVGTPAYMAPEQLAGERIDALSDQFSFCVALYEGLYGERPYNGRALAELIANVCEGRLRAAPRDAGVPRWLRRALLRGLSTEAVERYSDIDALLVALQRDPSRSWRRWGTVVLPAGVLAIGIAAHQRDPPRRDNFCSDVDQRLHGVWDTHRRQAIEDAFTETGKPFAAHSFKAVARALDSYAARWVSLQQETCAAQTRGDVPRAVLAMRMSCLEHHLDTLGTLTEVLAETDAESVDRTLDAVMRLPDPAICEDVDRMTMRLGMLEIPDEAESHAAELVARARVLRDAGRYDEALDAARQAATAAAEAGSDRAEAEALQIIAACLDLSGRVTEAESAYHIALTAALRVDHPAMIARIAIGLTWMAQPADGDLASAERWARHGLAAVKRMGGDPELEAQLQTALGMTYLSHNRYAEAEARFRSGLEIREAAFGSEHGSLSEPLNAMGQLMGTQGEYLRAAEYFERARKLMEQEYGPQHPNTATAIGNLGVAYSQMGDSARARMVHEDALAIRVSSLGADHPHTATSHHNIALAFADLGRFDDALVHNLQALGIYRRAFGSQSLDVAMSLASVASLERRRGRHEDAVRGYREAIEIARALVGDEHPKTTRYQIQLAETMSELGRHADAYELMQTAAAAREAALTPDHPEVARTLESLARLLIEGLDDPDQAVEVAERAVRIDSSRSDADPTHLARTQFELARALWTASAALRDRPRAHALATAALTTLEQYPGKTSEADVVRAWLNTRSDL
jgi:eukaryotic-like serine/threonine-protein kinase